jgi:hypothetical protein
MMKLLSCGLEGAGELASGEAYPADGFIGFALAAPEVWPKSNPGASMQNIDTSNRSVQRLQEVRLIVLLGQFARII